MVLTQTVNVNICFIHEFYDCNIYKDRLKISNDHFKGFGRGEGGGPRSRAPTRGAPWQGVRICGPLGDASPIRTSLNTIVSYKSVVCFIVFSMTCHCLIYTTIVFE